MKVRCAMIDDATSLNVLLSANGDYVTKQKGNNIDNSQSFDSIDELSPINLIALLKQWIKYDKNNSSAVIRSYKTMDKAIEKMSEKYIEQNGTAKKQSLQQNYLAFIKNDIRSDGKSLSAKYLPFYLLEYEYKFKRRGLNKNIFPEFMEHIFHSRYASNRTNEDAGKKQNVRA